MFGSSSLSLSLSPAFCTVYHCELKRGAQECVISNLLTQKKDIKRQSALVEKLRVDEETERSIALEKARERVLEDFEKAQAGGKKVGGANAAVARKTDAVPVVAGVKRKFEIEDDEVERLVKEAEEKALAQLEAEQVRRGPSRYLVNGSEAKYRKRQERPSCPISGFLRSHPKRHRRSWPMSSYRPSVNAVNLPTL